MTLTEQLQDFRAEFMAKVPAEIRTAMENADLDLAATNIINNAIKAGDTAPDFRLKNVNGEWLRLSEQLKKGPVVLSFYRGGWCPYCNLELRALQAVLPQIQQLGASLLAVSPQTPDESLSTAEKNALGFAVLSDTQSEIAMKYGIAFDLATELRPIYTQFNHALPVMNGDESWRLPIPASYVIKQDGSVALAFIDVDYRNRLEPAEIVKALQAIGSASGRGTESC